MSGGETTGEAIANAMEALRDFVAVFQESGRKVRMPGIHPKPSLQRVVVARLTEAPRSRRLRSERWSNGVC